ncbi:MAG TPA: hypothetical protein VKX35_02725 [Fermentimonas sp.]|nr:hypothetical protein [Fermentimonas sp.]
MRDFTLKTYIKLIEALKDEGFSFQTFQEFVEKPEKRAVVMRHDVDRLPGNAMKIAEIEKKMGIKATYYFRMDISERESIVYAPREPLQRKN